MMELGKNKRRVRVGSFQVLSDVVIVDGLQSMLENRVQGAIFLHHQTPVPANIHSPYRHNLQRHGLLSR